MAISPNSLTPIDASQGLINSFDKTNLDLENASVLGGPNKDLQTQYPATSTGTPTSQANPSAAKNYIPKFTPTNTYLNQVVGNSNSVGATSPNAETISSSPILQLVSSLSKTNLDIENPGSPKKDYSTQYPKNVSGTPTVLQNPVGPAKTFLQQYTPQDPYENKINNKIISNSVLSNNAENPTILEITNLDVENPSVIGGPNKDTTTVYPPLVSGTPTTMQNPSEAPKNFDQLYSPSKTYLSDLNTRNKAVKNSPLSGNPEDPKILNVTNLDNSKLGVLEYKADINDPTEYPTLSTGRTEIKAWMPSVLGAVSTPSQKFNPKYSAAQKYDNPEPNDNIPPQVEEPLTFKKAKEKLNKDADGAIKAGKGLVNKLTSFFGK